MSAEDVRVRITDEVTVVATAATGPTGATGAPGADGADAVYSDATPAALGVAAPGTADLAAREGHVHPMPTPGEVGADPAGTAAGLVTAHVDDTTAAHAASAVSVDPSPWGGVADDVAEALVEVPSLLLALLPELEDGIGTRVDASSGLSVDATVATRVNLTAVASTAAATTLLTSTVTLTDMQVTTSGRIVAMGGVTNNTGSARNVTITVKIGAIGTWTFPFSAIPSSGTGRYWRADIDWAVFDFIGLRPTGLGRASLSAAGAGVDVGSWTVAMMPAGSGTFTAGDSLAIDVTTTMSTSSSSLSSSCALLKVHRSVAVS